MFPSWVDRGAFKDRAGVRVGDIVSGNDGDLALSGVTDVLLGRLPAPFCIDIGAAEGWWSEFVKMRKPEAQILAFEPNPGAFQRLFRRWKHLKGATVLPYAVSNKQGELLFNLDGERTHSRSNGKDRLPCVKLDPYIIQQVDFLKIDTEGHEPYILFDIQDRLPLFRNVCFEFSPFWYASPQHAVALLQMMGREYPYTYHLARREIRAHPIDLKDEKSCIELVKACMAQRYQTDILCSRESLVDIVKSWGAEKVSA